MKKNPIISIIMSCFNGEKFIDKSVKSILKQTYKNWELIFWDNNSNDDSKKKILSFNDKRIKYYKSDHTTNLGISRSNAILKANGDLIAFLDVDDFWFKKKLQYAAEAFQNNDDLGVFFSNYVIYFGNKKFKKKISSFVNQPDNLNKILESYVKNTQLVAFLTVVIDKKILDAEPYYFDSNLHITADFDLFIRLSEKYKFFLYKKPLGIYRRHEKNETKNSLEQQTNEQLLCYNKFIKNYSVNQITLRKMKEDIDYNFAKLDIYKKNYKLFFGKLMMIRRFKLKIKLFTLFIFNIINNKNII